MDAIEQIEPRLREILDLLIQKGEFRLSYRLVPHPEANREFENPDLLVDLEGPDSDLLLANGGELLRAFEHLAHEALRLSGDEHERLIFDCQNRRMLRIDELRQAAELAAQRVVKTGLPYAFGPMNSRERRVIHMALRGTQGIHTASEGIGPQRHVVIQSATAFTPVRRFQRR